MFLPGAVADINPESGYALTAANFPWLLDAFVGANISGNNLVGSLGNVTLTNTAGWTVPAAGQFRRAVGTLTTSGTWPAIGIKQGLLIAIGSFNHLSAIVTRFGSGTGTSMSIGSGSAQGLAELTSTSNKATLPATTLTTNDATATAIRLDQSTANGDAYGYWYDGTTFEGPVIQDTLVGDISGTWPAFITGAASAAITTDGSSYYTGIFMGAFTTIPSDAEIEAALIWMAAHPAKIYPGFYHLT